MAYWSDSSGICHDPQGTGAEALQAGEIRQQTGHRGLSSSNEAEQYDPHSGQSYMDSSFMVVSWVGCCERAFETRWTERCAVVATRIGFDRLLLTRPRIRGRLEDRGGELVTPG